MVVVDIKQALDARLGRTVALASAYNLLHRHGWRKLAPDKRHPQADVAAQEDWKKLANRLGQIDRQWQGDGPIRLMFQDEAHLGRISDTRRCWCPKPIRLLCYAMATQEYTYAYAAVSVADGQLDTLILPHVNGQCMQVFPGEVAHHHPDERILRCSTAPAGIRARRSCRRPICAGSRCRPPPFPEVMRKKSGMPYRVRARQPQRPALARSYRSLSALPSAE